MQKTYIVAAKIAHASASDGPEILLGEVEFNSNDDLVLPKTGAWQPVDTFARFELGQAVRYDKSGVLVHARQPRAPRKKSKKNAASQ